MRLIVAVPCYALRPPAAGQALLQTVQKIHAAMSTQIHVFHAPGQELSMPAGVTAHVLALAPEPVSSLPLGWLTAACALADLFPGSAVLVVSPANPNLSAQRVAQAAAQMARLRTGALLAMTPSRDHPCQWQEFFDVTVGQAFVPVDAQAGDLGGLVAQALGLSGRAQVSAPFTMPASGPWPQGHREGMVLEWFQEQGVLRVVSAGTPSPARPLEQRVFLLTEGGARVRQAAFCGRDLAALPLFRPVGRAAACFLRLGALWSMGLAPGLSAASRYQVFSLPEEHQPCGLGGAESLHPVVLSGETLPVAGTGYLGADFLPPVPGATLFLLNVLAPAQLPKADIVLPYHSALGGWELDQRTMETINSATGERITGRQSFPAVLELEGSLLGLSAESLRDPLASLLAAENVEPLVLEEDEMHPFGQGLAWPTAPPDTRGPTAGAESPARRVEALLAKLQQLRDDLDLDHPDPDARHDSGSRREDGAASARLDRAMANLADIRCLFASLTLELDTVIRHVKDSDEMGMGLFPLHLYMLHKGRGLQRLPPKLEHGMLYPLVSALLESWERFQNAGGPGETRTLAAFTAMRARASQLGLHPCWAAGLALALAGKGLHRQTLDMLREDYARVPWLQQEFIRVAVQCFRPQFRYEEYLLCLEQDALTGRMSPSNMYYYCEALAVCRQEERAERAVAEAYAKHPSLENLYAVIALWRFGVRDFEPTKGLPLYEKDAAEGRLSGCFVLWHAAAVAAAGEVERACTMIDRAYAEDATAANGYARVGWYYHMLLRREPEAAIALFQRDASLERLEASWKSYLAAAHAFKGDLETAEGIVEAVYAESPFHICCFAQLGLAHWLSHGKIDVVLRCFQRDLDLGRLRSIDVQLLHHAFLSHAGRADTPGAREALDGVPVTVMAWDLGVARLGQMGFREEDVAGLMTPTLRARFFATAPERASGGGR